MDGAEWKIWQRVLEEPRQGAIGETLYRMAEISRRAIRDYRLLAGRHRGNGGLTLRQLEAWERENLACIRGLSVLCTGRPLGSNPEICREQGLPGGEQMYRRALGQLQEYTALSAQPGFGVVFGEMARRQTLLCEALVRLLGDGEKIEKR